MIFTYNRKYIEILIYVYIYMKVYCNDRLTKRKPVGGLTKLPSYQNPGMVKVACLSNIIEV